MLSLPPSVRVFVATQLVDGCKGADELPAGVEALDFFHASEHLHAAIAAAYGDGARRWTSPRSLTSNSPTGSRVSGNVHGKEFMEALLQVGTEKK